MRANGATVDMCTGVPRARRHPPGGWVPNAPHRAGVGRGWGGPCQLSGCKPAEINPKRVIKERRIITIMFTTRKAAHTCHTLRAAEVAKG